jgi:hypothetical protein
MPGSVKRPCPVSRSGGRELGLTGRQAKRARPERRQKNAAKHARSDACRLPANPRKVVPERLGQHSPASTQDTYQHLLPGMGEAAARWFEALVLEPDEGRQRRDP